MLQIKTAHSHKGPLEFDNLMYVQEIAGMNPKGYVVVGVLSEFPLSYRV